MRSRTLPLSTGCGWSKTRRTRFRPPGGRAPTRRGSSAAAQTAAVSCFSFYANKTITTGEGGMAVTDDAIWPTRMRLMSLHGLSHDAWGRYTGGRQLGLPDHRARLQIQPDRHRRRDRHPSAGAGRRDAARSARAGARISRAAGRRGRNRTAGGRRQPHPRLAPVSDSAACSSA